MKLLSGMMVFNLMFTLLAVQYPTVTVKRGVVRYHPNYLVAVTVILLVTLVSGLRSNIGDTAMYMHSFGIASDSLRDYLRVNGTFDLLFIYGLRTFTKDPQSIILVTSLIIYPCILWRIFKSSVLPEMSLFLFFTLGAYVTSMNGIRQYLVTALLFALYPFILKLKKPYVVVLLLLISTIHATVLLLIPIYLVMDWKPWSGRVMVLFGLAAALFLLFNQISPIFYDLMQGTRYADYETAEYTLQKVSIFRILVTAIPVLLLFMIRNNPLLRGREMNFLVNATFFNFIFMLFGFYGASYARFALYFELYPLLVYPVVARAGFLKEKDRKLFIILVYIFSATFFSYQMLVAFGGFRYVSRVLGIVVD